MFTYARIVEHTVCIEALLASYGSQTFLGGGLRCRSGNVAFTANSVVTFDGQGDSAIRFIFRASGTITVGGGVLFLYVNGAASSRVFFVSQDQITMGTGTGRVRFGGTLIGYNAVVLQEVHMTGQVLARLPGAAVIIIGNTLANRVTLNAPMVDTVDVSACAAYSIHAGTLTFPTNALAAPTLGGLLASNTVSNTAWGYIRTPTSAACFAVTSAMYTAVTAASAECQAATSVGNTTYTGGVMYCYAATVSYIVGSTITFDGSANIIVRTAGAFTWINGFITFRYINGASPSSVFIFAASSLIGGGTTMGSSVGGTFITNGATATTMNLRTTNITGRLLTRSDAGVTMTSVVPHDAASQLRVNDQLPPSLVPPSSTGGGAAAMSSTGEGMAPSSSGPAEPDAPTGGPVEAVVALQFDNLSTTMDDLTLGEAIVQETAAATATDASLIVLLSLTRTGNSVSAELRMPIATALVLRAFVSATPDNGVQYPIYTRSTQALVTPIIPEDAPLPALTSLNITSCTHCGSVGSCFGGICGCTPDAGICLNGTLPAGLEPTQTELCVSGASLVPPFPDVCTSALSTANALVYASTPCDARTGDTRSHNLCPSRLFCQSLDYALGRNRFVFTGLFGNPYDNTTALYIYTLLSPLPSLAAIVEQGLNVDTGLVTADVYLSNIYDSRAPTVSQFWVQVEFSAIYSDNIVLLTRVTGRDTLEGSPGYYWFNDTWNAWELAEENGVLPAGACALWDPVAAKADWECMAHHVYDDQLMNRCVPGCNNGNVGRQCLGALDPAVCAVRTWNSTSMAYITYACDRVVCKLGFTESWGDCVEEPVVPAWEPAVADDSSSSTPVTTPIIVSIFVIGVGVMLIGTLVARNAVASGTAAAKGGTTIHIKPKPPRATVRPSPRFDNVIMS